MTVDFVIFPRSTKIFFKKMQQLIILDRDGVINEDSDQFIKSAEEFKAIPGSLEAIARLSQNGYRVVIATNQSGLGRGLFDMDALNKIHNKMHQALANLGGQISAIFFCPHTPDDQCSCRKPKDGMFKEIASTFNVSLKDVPSVGDSLRDLQASFGAGCRPILVLTGKGQKTLSENHLPQHTLVFADLAAVVDFLLAPEGKEEIIAVNYAQDTLL